MSEHSWCRPLLVMLLSKLAHRGLAGSAAEPSRVFLFYNSARISSAAGPVLELLIMPQLGLLSLPRAPTASLYVSFSRDEDEHRVNNIPSWQRYHTGELRRKRQPCFQTQRGTNAVNVCKSDDAEAERTPLHFWKFQKH